MRLGINKRYFPANIDFELSCGLRLIDVNFALQITHKKKSRDVQKGAQCGQSTSQFFDMMQRSNIMQNQNWAKSFSVISLNKKQHSKTVFRLLLKKTRPDDLLLG